MSAPPSLLDLLALPLQLLAPAACLACGRTPPRATDALCAPCRAALPWLSGPRCPRCALPAHAAGSPCRAPAGAPARAWAPMAHAGPAAALVVALKHRRLLRAADTMAAQIVANAPPGVLPREAALVPVPADPLRARVRGLDHGARLAAAIATRSGLPVRACLRRERAARAQVGRGRRARLATTAGSVTLAAEPPERRLVLVDDVHTTGATLAACAAALRTLDGRCISAVTYARAL